MVGNRKTQGWKGAIAFFAGIIAFMALRCAKYADRCLIHFFIAHILSNLLQYMLTLAIHGERVGYVRAAA